MHIIVDRDQSLASIARARLGAGASAVEVKAAAAAIGAANGLPVTARIRAGQPLVVPDVFLGDLTTGGVSAEALARLSARPARGTGPAQAQHAAKPVLDYMAVFSPVSVEKGAPVEIAPIAGVPVRAHELVMTSVRTRSVHESALRSVHVELGVLTEAQFLAVRQELGGLGTVAFDPARVYVVQDFFPPALQALVNQDFEMPEPRELKGTKNIGEDFGIQKSDRTVYFTMNCHGTAWEGMRAYQGQCHDEVAVYYADKVLMANHAREGTALELLGEVPQDRLHELLSMGMKPGDLVHVHMVSSLVSASTDLMHSALYVGGGLFVDKPNTEGAEREDRARYVEQDETPIRLATLDLMTAPLKHAAGQFGDTIRAEVFRPKEPLPDGRAAFGTPLQGELEAWAANKGRRLGAELVSMLETKTGGQVCGEEPSVLVRVPLVKNQDGTARLGV